MIVVWKRWRARDGEIGRQRQSIVNSVSVSAKSPTSLLTAQSTGLRNLPQQHLGQHRFTKPFSADVLKLSVKTVHKTSLQGENYPIWGHLYIRFENAIKCHTLIWFLSHCIFESGPNHLGKNKKSRPYWFARAQNRNPSTLTDLYRTKTRQLQIHAVLRHFQTFLIFNSVSSETFFLMLLALFILPKAKVQHITPQAKGTRSLNTWHIGT